MSIKGYLTEEEKFISKVKEILAEEESKKLSSGIVLTDGKVILGCKVKYGKGWDIPKGEIDKGETPKQAAIRETKEKVGIDIKSDLMTDHGKFPKDLFIFEVRVYSLPNIGIMKCDSTYIDKKTGRELPEVLEYKYIPIDQIEKHFTPPMARVINKVLK